jgi:hypothetical protein
MSSPHRIPALREGPDDGPLPGSSTEADLVVPVLLALTGAVRAVSAFARGERWGAEATIALVVAAAASAAAIDAGVWSARAERPPRPTSLRQRGKAR